MKDLAKMMGTKELLSYLVDFKNKAANALHAYQEFQQITDILEDEFQSRKISDLKMQSNKDNKK